LPVSIIKRGTDCPGTALQDMGIDHGSFDIFLTKQFLHGTDIIAILEQMGSIGWKGGALFLAEYVSAQPPPNRTGNSSLHPAFPHSISQDFA
jgi:hypothetical protein